MNVYQVRGIGSANTVQAFLAQSQRQPVITDAAKKIPELIRCKGIVHYTRSGTRTVVTSGGYVIEEGDFLVVATQCSTGKAEVIPATFVPTEYAFVMGSTTDDFYNAASLYMNRRPTTTVIDTCHSLEAVLQMLKNGEKITTPIKNVVIVSHARGEGILYFALNDDDDDTRIYLDELCPFVDSAERTHITGRVLKNDPATNLYIRGCNIGNEPRFLRFLKSIFGSNVTVTAPKHFDYFYTFQLGDEIDISYEFMKYDFTVNTNTVVQTKKELVRLFNNEHFTDIDNVPIPEARWTSWIPKSIHDRSIERHTCTNPVHAQMNQFITREYRYNARTIFAPDQTTIAYEKTRAVPTSQKDRIADLKQCIRNNPQMQEDYPSPTCNLPLYKRYGYTSINDLVDHLEWTIRWYPKKRVMTFLGRRFEHQLRIPVTDAGNVLMLNTLPASGKKEYQYHNILETDNRFFGRV
jgi:hypothetical protein